MSAQNLKRKEGDVTRFTRFQWTFMKISSPHCKGVLPKFCELLDKVNPAFTARDFNLLWP